MDVTKQYVTKKHGFFIVISSKNLPSMRPMDTPICLAPWIACIISRKIAIWPSRVILETKRIESPLF